MVLCFLLFVEDSIEGILYVIFLLNYLLKIGGGVVLNLFKFRVFGEFIKDIEGVVGGVVGVVKMLE